MKFVVRTRIDFLSTRYILLGVSACIIAIGIATAALEGFNYGIDFAGGTMVRVAFREPRPDEAIRQAVSTTGFKNPTIQTLSGTVQETLIRLEGSGKELDAEKAGAEGATKSISDRIVQALDSPEDQAAQAAKKIDLNAVGKEVIADALLDWDPEGLGKTSETAKTHYIEVAASVKERQKKNHGILTSFDNLQDEVPSKTLEALKSKAFLASRAVLEVGYVGPQVGKELRQRAILATFFACAGILIYIWVRFELEFGVAAIVALFHDLFITLGLLAVLRIEFNLTIVAALLTIVGYSVNDTIVIFDRIRENLRLHRRAEFVDLCNYSINQTLSRTVLTAATTLFVLVSLAIVGSDVARGFAITLGLGILIGTYSSIYVASPTAILLRTFNAKRKERRIAKG